MCVFFLETSVPPNATKIGGALLDLNFKMTYERNKEELLKEAAVHLDLRLWVMGQ